MSVIPKEYVVAKFRQYGGRAIQKGKNWNAACPICREGKHWNEKRRLFYLTKDDYLYCHNCSESWTPINWIKEVTNLDYAQIHQQIREEGYDCFEIDEVEKKVSKPILTLPSNPIDLYNKQQLEYYTNNRVVKDCIRMIKERRLHTAINRCPKYFLSLDDFKFRNRLIIPYYDEQQGINFFTCRSLYKNQTPKYLNKYGDKEIFNFNRIDGEFPYIFIFEGQIDAMFIKNGIAVSGVMLTDYQSDQIKRNYPNHELIWVLDNPKIDTTSKKVIIENTKQDKTFKCFTYTGDFENHKDFNLYCVANKSDSVDPNYIIQNSKKGNALLFNI